MDAFYVEGGMPYLRTKQLKLGALPFEAVLTIWTDPENPSDIALKGAVDLVNSDVAFRTEVERRFFDDYNDVTRAEYLEYANDPAYGITPEMLPTIERHEQVWSIFHPLQHAASIHEPNDMYPSDVAEVVLSFGVSFDKEHDLQITFKDGKFFELTR